MNIDQTTMNLIIRARNLTADGGAATIYATQEFERRMTPHMSPIETVRVAVLLADLHQAETLIRAAHNILEGISK